MGTQLDTQAWVELLRKSTNISNQYAFTKASPQIQELNVPPNWFLLWIALELEPNAVDADGFAIQNPYGAPDSTLEQMAGLAEQGYLKVVDDNAYKLTEKGRDILGQAIDLIFNAGNDLDVLPQDEAKALADTLGVLVDNALNSEVIEKRDSLQRNNKSYPGDDAHPMARIFHFLTDVNAYRDDCHMATWRWKYDVDGPTWESFSMVWKEDAQTPAEVLAKLPFRGYDEARYSKAFAKLESLGWIKKNADGKYEVTDEGRTVREESERLTDEYFMAPISALGDKQAKLAKLLTIYEEKISAAQDRQVKTNLWGKLQEVLTNMTPHYQGTTNSMLQSINATGLNWGVLFHAQGVAPELLTVDRMLKAAPFNAPEVLKDRLEQTREKGLLEAVNGGYAMTETGAKGIAAFFSLAHEALSEFEPIPSEDLEKLANYLKKIVEKTESDGPTLKIHFDNSRKTDPGGLSYLAQIDQYVTDITRLRDDAHNAVWRALDVDPYAWDAFTQIWNGTANTVEAIAKQLENRKVSVETYGSGLASLVARGWVTKNNGEYALTPEGQAVRDQAEIDTDLNFFVGWQDFTPQDLQTIRQLTDKLNHELKMQGYLKIWQSAQETMQAFAPFYRPVTVPLLQEAGYQGPDWFDSLVSWGIEPQPLTIDVIKDIAPYGNHDVTFEERIAGTVERGFLSEKDGNYKLTTKGRETIQGFFSNSYNAIANIEALPDEQMQVLTDILKKVVNETIASDHRSTMLEISRVTHPSGANLAAHVDQYLTDLVYYRDDAHIAAWREKGLTGPELEVLSFIWQGEHTTADTILEQRQGRGYTAEEYQGFIANLAERGLVVADGDSYAVTDEGRELREAIEARTNEIFFTAWENLTGFEIFQLMNLLTQLRTKLQELAPEPEAA